MSFSIALQLYTLRDIAQSDLSGALDQAGIIFAGQVQGNAVVVDAVGGFFAPQKAAANKVQSAAA